MVVKNIYIAVNRIAVESQVTINLKTFYTAKVSELAEVLAPEEAGSITQWVMEEIFCITPSAIWAGNEINLGGQQMEAFDKAMVRIKQHEPVQYVLGYTEFMGLKIKVAPGVLIPRPETEELAHKILASGPPPLPIAIDVGTGSGAIAIALAKAWPGVRVIGTDFSPVALKIAQENASMHGIRVEWIVHDILKEPLPDISVGILVSNPPYVRESEKKTMQPNVLDFEPHEALFVDDDDPLIFYKKLAMEGARILCPEGRMFCEINEAFGKATASMLEEQGFVNVEIIQDFRNKDRIVTGRKKP